MKQANFKDIYDSIYEKCGEEMEKKRKKALRKTIIAFAIAVAIWVGLVLSIQSGLTFLIAIIFVITVFGLIFAIAKVTHEYKKSFKENVITEIVNKSNPNLRYSYNSGISSNDYRASDFEHGWDKYNSEDLITGTLEDSSNLKMAQVHTQERYTTTDANGHTQTTYVTKFLGLFGIIKLKTATTADFTIVNNSAFSKFNKDRIEMESSEFEKYFDVFSGSRNSGTRQNAMEMITPEVIEEFVKLRNIYKKAINIRIVRDTIYFRLEAGDIFEAPTFKNSVSFDLLQKYFLVIDFPRMIYEIFIDNILVMYGTQSEKEKRNLATSNEANIGTQAIGNNSEKKEEESYFSTK